MKKLNIDTKKHMGYSRSAERGIKARLSQKYSPVECERLMEKIDRKYEEYLVDLPYCGGKHNLMIWQLYDAIAAFTYFEVLPEKETPEEFTKTCAVIFEKDKQRKPLPRLLTVDSKGFVRLVRAAIRPIAKNMNRKLDSGEWQDDWRMVDVPFKSGDAVPSETSGRQTAKRYSHHRFGGMDESDLRDLLRRCADRSVHLNREVVA